MSSINADTRIEQSIENIWNRNKVRKEIERRIGHEEYLNGFK